MGEEEKDSQGRHKEPGADDPMALVMHSIPVGDPVTMARCLIEEYALLGLGEGEILELFRQPIYQTHGLYREHGELWVRELIRSVLARTGPMRVSVRHLDHIGGCDA